ncbi:hypothetical protein BJ165DRAFT_1525758 [Panaeolus papilionaceus]|nr:hypothetical protein BJ165DRAFT_1525758 [Panaeolus papilionaceus]
MSSLDNTVILGQAALNIEGVSHSSASAPVEQDAVDNTCQSTTRQKALPNRLAALEDAQKYFLVNGEKWVILSEDGKKPPKKRPSVQKQASNSLMHITPAPDHPMQDVYTVEQAQQPMAPYNTPVDGGSSTSSYYFTTGTYDELDKGSDLSLSKWACLESYLPSQSSVPRALADVHNAINSALLSASPNSQYVRYTPQAEVSQIPAATIDLSTLVFDKPFPASQVEVPIPETIRDPPLPSMSYQMGWGFSANAVDGGYLAHQRFACSGELDAGILGSQSQLQAISEVWEDFAQDSQATGEFRVYHGK